MMFRLPVLPRLAVLCLALLAPAASGQTPENPPSAADAVQIPNFWDPRARLERPSPAEVGAIRFLTADDFPPFAFRDRRGMLIGFDVDLAAAICRVLEVPCAIQARPFDTLTAALNERIGNAIIGGFDPEKAGAEG